MLNIPHLLRRKLGSLAALLVLIPLLKTGNCLLGASSNDIIATAEVDKLAPFVGEQVILTYKILTRQQIQGIDIESAPEFGNFLVENAWNSERPEIRLVNHNGSTYQELTVKRTALYPLIAKESLIPALTFAIDLAAAKPKTIYRQTNQIRIFPKPLPTENRPPNFSGVVGDYQLTLDFEDESIHVGEPVNLVLKIAGSGNMNILVPPRIESNAQFKVYAAKLVHTKFGLDVARMSSLKNPEYRGEKVWDIKLLPKVAGKSILKPVSLAYFNPNDQSYHVIQTRPLQFEATRREFNAERPEKDRGGEKRSSYMSFGNLMVCIGVILALLGISILWHQHFAKKRRIVDSTTEAAKILQRHIEEAKALMSNRNSKKFFDLVAKGTRDYIRVKFDISLLVSKVEEIKSTLVEDGVSALEAERIGRVLELCDYGRFATVDLPKNIREEIYSEVMRLVQMQTASDRG